MGGIGKASSKFSQKTALDSKGKGNGFSFLKLFQVSQNFCFKPYLIHRHDKNRAKSVTNYLTVATNQPTYGVELFKGLADKNKRAWVVGVCYSGLHRYHPGQLEQPEKVFDWKKLENLFYRDKKFSVEICQDSGEDGKLGNTRGTYSWYGRGAVIKALWNAAIHAHQAPF